MKKIVKKEESKQKHKIPQQPVLSIGTVGQ